MTQAKVVEMHPTEAPASVRTIQEIPLADLHPATDNPRGKATADPDMVASIKAHGVLEPLIVVERDGKYVVVAGHRRLDGAKKAKLDTAPCEVRTLSEQDRLVFMLVENLHRADLDPIAEAGGYAQVITIGMSQKDLAKSVGRSQAHISKRLSLFELPDNAQTMLRAGDITLDQAQMLLQLKAWPKEMERIVKNEQPSGWEWKVRAKARSLQLQAEAKKELDGLIAEGHNAAKKAPNGAVEIIDPQRYSYGGSKKIDMKKHTKLACHFTTIRSDGNNIERKSFCTAPAQHDADGKLKLKWHEVEVALAAGKTPEEATKAAATAAVPEWKLREQEREAKEAVLRDHRSVWLAGVLEAKPDTAAVMALVLRFVLGMMNLDLSEYRRNLVMSICKAIGVDVQLVPVTDSDGNPTAQVTYEPDPIEAINAFAKKSGANQMKLLAAAIVTYRFERGDGDGLKAFLDLHGYVPHEIEAQEIADEQSAFDENFPLDVEEFRKEYPAFDLTDAMIEQAKEMAADSLIAGSDDESVRQAIWDTWQDAAEEATTAEATAEARRENTEALEDPDDDYDEGAAEALEAEAEEE